MINYFYFRQSLRLLPEREKPLLQRNGVYQISFCERDFWISRAVFEENSTSLPVMSD